MVKTQQEGPRQRQWQLTYCFFNLTKGGLPKTHIIISCCGRRRAALNLHDKMTLSDKSADKTAVRTYVVACDCGKMWVIVVIPLCGTGFLLLIMCKLRHDNLGCRILPSKAALPAPRSVSLMKLLKLEVKLQRPAIKCANLAKRDLGQARLKSQARGGRNFSQSRTIFSPDLWLAT